MFRVFGGGTAEVAARATRDARRIDRIACRPEERIDRRHAAAELVSIGLAEQHGAREFEPIHRWQL